MDAEIHASYSAIEIGFAKGMCLDGAPNICVVAVAFGRPSRAAYIVRGDLHQEDCVCLRTGISVRKHADARPAVGRRVVHKRGLYSGNSTRIRPLRGK